MGKMNLLRKIVAVTISVVALSCVSSAYDGRYVQHHRWTNKSAYYISSPRIYVVVWYDKKDGLPRTAKFYHKTPAMVLQQELISRGYSNPYIVNIKETQYDALQNKLGWVFAESCLRSAENLDLSKYPMFNASAFKQDIQSILNKYNLDIDHDNICQVTSLKDLAYKLSISGVHDKDIRDIAYNIYLYFQDLKKYKNSGNTTSNNDREEYEKELQQYKQVLKQYKEKLRE